MIKILNYKDIPENIRCDFDICEGDYLKIKMTNKRVTIEVIKSNDKK